MDDHGVPERNIGEAMQFDGSDYVVLSKPNSKPNDALPREKFDLTLCNSGINVKLPCGTVEVFLQYLDGYNQQADILMLTNQSDCASLL